MSGTALPPARRDTLTLVVGGRQYTGWLRVQVVRGIEIMPSSFDVELTERFPGDAAQVDVKAGDPCQVMLGADLVLTGFVDRRVTSIGLQGSVVRISGRSCCQDLVDCDVDPDKLANMQINEANLGLIAKDLAGQYGIKVQVLSSGNGKPIPQTNVGLGEKPFEVIERLARFVALIVYDDVDGTLVLNAVGTKTMASGFAEGVNIERAQGLESMDSRFSDYAVYVSSSLALSDVGPIQPAARVRDTTVTRFRKRVIVSEQAMLGVDIAAQRGKWELARRYGRSQTVSLTTDSWRDSAGALWAVNSLATIDSPHMKLVGKVWLITQVSFRRDSSGTHADLVLMPKAAFAPEPVFLAPYDLEIYRAHQQGGGGAAAADGGIAPPGPLTGAEHPA